MSIDKVFFIFEIIGTVAFAITGVITAIEKKLDIFGAVVLGTVTAVGGGMVRDILLGYLPPAAFRHPVYTVTAIATSLAVFIIAYFFGKRIKLHFNVYYQIINVFDAIGLAVFTVAGINSAAACGFGENSFLSIFVGMMTGVGGGVMRDMMAGGVPTILRKKVYALAAGIGALIYQLLVEHNTCPQGLAILAGAGSIIVIRLSATVFKWNLPTLKDLD